MKKAKNLLIAGALALSTITTVPAAYLSTLTSVAAFTKDETSSGKTISITNVTDSTKTYTVYQIFKGDYSGGVLVNLDWGDSVQNHPDGTASAYLDSVNDTELQSDIKSWKNNSGDTGTKLVAGEEMTYESGSKSYVLTGVPTGYYVIFDETDNTGNTDYADTVMIVKVVGNGATLKQTDKYAKPSVDKTVQDEKDDNDSSKGNEYREEADHEIGEVFNFKIDATIPYTSGFDLYKTYEVTLNDTMSSGVTFVSLDNLTVTVNGNTLTRGTDYTISFTNADGTVSDPNGEAGLSFTLNIPDIKKGNSKWITGITKDATPVENITVEVIYQAYLNKNAIVVGGTETGGNYGPEGSDTYTNQTNINKVNLEYSNNPETNGKGTTDDDYVWVFAYGLDNYKYALGENDTQIKLSDAKFILYYGETVTEGKEVHLVYDSTLKAYRPYDPTKDGTAPSKWEITSQSDGTFNVVGLDAGKYTLKETEAPEGYNLLTEPISITIAAVHKENSDGKSVNLSLNGSVKRENPVLNTKGTTLPETGGMGTTMFYIIGGVLVAGAAVLLITKKRMGNEA